MNFLIGIFLAVATASPAPQITGTVVDDNGKPVSGVSVSVEPVMGGPVVAQVASQKDGSFTVSGIPSGSMVSSRKRVRRARSPGPLAFPTVTRASSIYDSSRDSVRRRPSVYRRSSQLRRTPQSLPPT
jgi:hypothetical protein